MGARGGGARGYVVTLGRVVVEGASPAPRLPRLRSGTQGGCWGIRSYIEPGRSPRGPAAPRAPLWVPDQVRQVGRKCAPGGWAWLVNCGAPPFPTGAHKRRPYALSANDGIPTSWRRKPVRYPRLQRTARGCRRAVPRPSPGWDRVGASLVGACVGALGYVVTLSRVVVGGSRARPLGTAPHRSAGRRWGFGKSVESVRPMVVRGWARPTLVTPSPPPLSSTRAALTRPS